jgi:hypothetical protein
VLDEGRERLSATRGNLFQAPTLLFGNIGLGRAPGGLLALGNEACEPGLILGGKRFADRNLGQEPVGERCDLAGHVAAPSARPG